MKLIKFAGLHKYSHKTLSHLLETLNKKTEKRKPENNGKIENQVGPKEQKKQGEGF